MHITVRASAFALIALAGLLAAAIAAVDWVRALPAQDLPFAALDLEAPIGWATPMQLARIESDPAACNAALDASSIELVRLDDTSEGGDLGCGFTNAISLERTRYPYSDSVRVSCPLAAALYIWEREIVTPAALSLESPVARIEIAGTYACRRIYGRSEGRVSQHATANAVDVTGFRLENGRVVSVEAGWSQQGADAAFLREIRDGCCGVFDGVLSPDYNRAHADHLHLDMGPYDICR